MVPGEGPGFVHAENRCRTESLYGRNLPGQDIVPGHPPGADRKKHRQDYRKFFGKNCHCEGYSGKEPLYPVRTGNSICNDNHYTEKCPGEGDGPDNPRDLLLQSCLPAFKGMEDMTDFPHLSNEGGCRHPCKTLALHDQCTGVNKRLVIPSRPVPRHIRSTCCFPYRH